MNDTVWICPLMSGNVAIPSTVMMWCVPWTPMKCSVTLSPCLTTIWSGANVNDLKSHAPTLFGSVNLNPPPAGMVEFNGGRSAGCSGVF